MAQDAFEIQAAALAEQFAQAIARVQPIVDSIRAAEAELEAAG